MADPISLIGLGVSAIGTFGGMSASKKAEKTMTAEKIASYEYNIERIKEETAGTVGDITREGAAYGRQQRAAIGASGAEIGSGTPLMAMIETASSIERDISRVKRAAQLETEYYEREIKLLGGGPNTFNQAAKKLHERARNPLQPKIGTPSKNRR